MKHQVSAHVFCLGNYAERYVPGGYFDDFSIDEMLEIFSKTEGLEGVFQMYPPALMPKDPVKIRKKVEDHNLKVSEVFIESWSDRKWKNGAYSTTEKNVRKEAIKIFKDGMDFAEELNAYSVLCWPAHDGFDYPFQANYYDGWNNLVDTLRELGEHNRNVKIAVEPKNKDPRQRQYVSNVGKLMMLVNEVGLDNVGGALDIGHSLMAQEHLGESVVILDRANKLFQIHINENYKDADPDMIFGTVNFWEDLEFYYYLNKTDYDGWQAIDIISPRDDRAKALQTGVKLVHKYKQMADKLLKHADEIDRNMEGYKFLDNINLITDMLF
ncbi:MAG TPA: sugar phosphate isomerase/epimerase [Spirochaetes bacterium]|nr:sugar phosphate isomerase/epimerase [Spirochaetota bacterium]